MLERKVLVYSKKPSLASTFVLSLISLIPGLLAFGGKSLANAKITSYLRSEEVYGLPFQFFNHNSYLQPLSTLSAAKMLDKAKGYLIGTTNTALLHSPEVKADAYINVDSKAFKLKNTHLNYLFKPSECESTFTRQLLKSVSGLKKDSSWSCIEEAAEEGISQYVGSNDYVRKEVEGHLHRFCVMMSVAELVCGSIDEEKNEEEMRANRRKVREMYGKIVGTDVGEDELSCEEEKKEVKKFIKEEKKEVTSKDISTRAEIISQVLQDYNLRFIKEWLETANSVSYTHLTLPTICSV
eukprot:TRINITY_DN14680_c0_g1_i2.p1 TRINITY_DN14680_c0_g1~~TRINITY_DN14680_c0_g1_i2.p1  ORF type:complete len:296 (-),score=70.04 TRINITY_DN14680_c0_g1_i2:41-928(-)